VGWLYDPTSNNKHYYYHKGWNIQAYIAYIAGIALPFAGFVGTLGAPVSEEATHLGQLGWIISFVVSFVVYCALCLVWPTQAQRFVKESGASWEESAGDVVIAADGTQVMEQGSGFSVEEMNGGNGYREKGL
jgi:NCS1 family nucleobase:cation symporter-1